MHLRRPRFRRTQEAWSAWKRTPAWLRKPVILIVGTLCLIAAPIIGWLPGPGGVAVMAVAITILATEYSWAERLRHLIVTILRYVGHWLLRRPRLAWSLAILGVISFIINISISLWIFVL